MRRRLGLTARLLLIVALAGILQFALAPPAPRGTPYLSSLSAAFATQAHAATTCEYKDCAGGSRHNIVCAKVAFPAIQCFVYHGTCLSNYC